GIGTRALIADTAIGSVGVTIAASANATGNGIAGIIQLMKKPMPMTVQKTRPSASSRMSPLSRSNPSFGMRQPSRNSSGGRNRRKKISGSSWTSCSEPAAIAAPNAIWTSGVGIARGITRTRIPLTTTAPSMNSTTLIVAISYGVTSDGLRATSGAHPHPRALAANDSENPQGRSGDNFIVVVLRVTRQPSLVTSYLHASLAVADAAA